MTIECKMSKPSIPRTAIPRVLFNCLPHTPTILVFTPKKEFSRTAPKIYQFLSRFLLTGLDRNFYSRQRLETIPLKVAYLFDNQGNSPALLYRSSRASK